MSRKHSLYDVVNLFKPLDTDKVHVCTPSPSPTTQLILLLSPFLPQPLYLLKSSSAQLLQCNALYNGCIPFINHLQLLINANPAAFSDKERMISCWMDCCARERWIIKGSWQRSITANCQNIEIKMFSFEIKSFKIFKRWNGDQSRAQPSFWQEVIRSWKTLSVTSMLANVK